MRIILHAFSLLGAIILISACTSTQSEKVTALQKKDKNLSCKEVLLEINEAEFYRKTAQQNKNPKVSSLMMPLGYVSTYMSAEEAMDAANARIDYLNRIYDILSCENAKDSDAPRTVAYPPYSDYQTGRMSYQPEPPGGVPVPAPYRY